MSRFWEDLGIGALVVAVIVILIGGVGIYSAAKLHTEHWVTFNVTKLPDRNMQYDANGNKNQYANLVYTNKGVFNNSDSIIPWKTKSSDIYAQLQQGKTYTCQVVGWRIGFFSMYQNIVQCKGFYQ